ncbi:hypothetical protein [Actinoplanes sp. NPDC049265]|uniref:hypothetical protein n=1 Tax=Actinoplanes sp. NPDC049265 TaxID=3363902 RepID=UPI0037180744
MLLLVMALIGLVYAVVTLAVTPGVIDRFRSAAGTAGTADVDGYVTVVWMFAAIGTVLAVVLFALYIVLALGLRRGSGGARVATWVLCGLGVLFGCGSGIAVGAQKAGEGAPGTLGFALSGAYPQSWISLNVGLVIAQVVGYLIVILLLAFGSGSFFRKTGDPGRGSQSYVALPTYGSANAYAQPVSGAPGPNPAAAFPASPAFPPSQAQPPYATPQPPYGAPVAAQPPYGAPQPTYPGAPAPTAEDQAFWSRPAPSEATAPPVHPAPAAHPTSGAHAAPAAHPAPAIHPASPGQPPAAVQPASPGRPAPGAGPDSPDTEPGARLASDEAWSQEPATLPPAASSPTPVAPPYAEPASKSQSLDDEKSV